MADLKRLLLPLTGIIFFHGSTAQVAGNKTAVAVNNEAHHKVVLENGYVRILEGNIAAHDTTPPHIHAANSVVVFLSASMFGIGIDGRPNEIFDVKPGDTRIIDYSKTPVTHTVWNQGEGNFHFLVVEMKHAQQSPVKPKDVNVTPGEDYHLTASRHARVLVAITNAPQALRPSGFLFIPPQNEFTVNARGADASRCLLLELD
jgi:hypothetical protein